MKRKLNANDKIRLAMRQAEREVLQDIRQNGPYDPLMPSLTWRKALNRLIARGKIKYSRRKRRHGYVLCDPLTRR